MNISIYEQELFGRTQWRAMRDDGCLICGCHQLDFDSKDDALTAIRGEVRRNKLGPCKIRVHLIDRQANGRRHIVEECDEQG